MAIITLTTDWHNDDFYVGAIKGRIFTRCPEVNVIDITHKIEGYKSAHAAFILKGTYHFFPAGTIHLLCTNGEITADRLPVCICHNGHFFVGADSKAFRVLFDDKPEKVIALAPDQFRISTFPELSVFTEAACMLANGVPPDSLGIDITDDFSVLNLSPSCKDDSISGSVIYIDSYKNLITDITLGQFDSLCHGRKFEIVVKNDTYKITRISKTYSEVQSGELLALFNSLGLLEIAMRDAYLATLANIECNNSVYIKFL